MKKIFFLLIFVNFLQWSSCAQSPASDNGLLNPTANTIEGRFLPPDGFERIVVPQNSFGAYLRQLQLKPTGSKVHFFNGDIKYDDAYLAVVDLDIGDKDLHQCADAVMRLKAEYLWRKGDYDKIHFKFTNGFRVNYSEWMKGRRMVVKGNKTYWNNRQKASNTYEDFWDYMELIFMYAGTKSLSKEMKAIPMSKMRIGDVLIKGGFPGHAVIVLDMVINKETGKKMYLLGQSYMPAQEIQVLKNKYYLEDSPWYPLNDDETIYTPEWTFYANQLKRFRE